MCKAGGTVKTPRRKHDRAFTSSVSQQDCTDVVLPCVETTGDFNQSAARLARSQNARVAKGSVYLLKEGVWREAAS